ncbi:hypothetical protein ACLB2K_023146 [Fragaria x ananassa]
MGSQSKAQVSRNRDMISELPDSVLSHMLSFLETKYAVRTSVLSTRWKNIWALVPIVNFELEDRCPRPSKSKHASFLSFVDRVLLYRDSSHIQRFRFHCDIYPKDLFRIDGWIRTAIRRNVVELDLQFLLRNEGVRQMFEFPISVFSCKTLVTLKLSSNCLIYAPPKSGCFPNLKFLYVKFCYPDYDSIEQLLSGCPRVEDLTIEGELTTPYNFKLFVPRLKRLTITVWYLDEYIDPYISNVEYLSLSAHFLYLVLRECYRWILLSQLLKRSPNLECLILEYEEQGDDESYLSDETNSADDEENLGDGTNSEDEENSGEEDSENEEYAKHHWWNREEPAPTCVLSHLKTVSISGFKGREDEREVVKYLLKNGEVLEKMTIYMGDFMHSKEEFYKEFSLFQRASKKFQVKFI